MSAVAFGRPAWVEVDLAAVRHNTAVLAAAAAPAVLLAVLKANAYGHGAVPVARAALESGANWLGVAVADEGAELRAAGIDAPILVLAEPHPSAAAMIVDHDLTPIVYTAAGIESLGAAVAAAGRQHPLPVHLKVDTGMHRVGASPSEALVLAKEIAHRPELELEGLLTHLAVADVPGHPATQLQLDRFEAVRSELRASGITPPLVHVANSAGLLAAGARYDLVRCGIALYGIPPAPGIDGGLELRPALSLRAHVSFVKELDEGERVSYGLHYAMPRRGNVATIPIGYEDGIRRRWSQVGGCVLIDGRRHPVAGAVTMDQILVDCGDAPVAVDDEVILIGRQGNDEITVGEWADRLGTIAYEILCQIGPRLPRVYLA